MLFQISFLIIHKLKRLKRWVLAQQTKAQRINISWFMSSCNVLNTILLRWLNGSNILLLAPTRKVKIEGQLVASVFILSWKEGAYCQCTVNLDLFLLASGNATTHAFDSSSMFTEKLYSYCWSSMTFPATLNEWILSNSSTSCNKDMQQRNRFCIFAQQEQQEWK